MTTLRVFLARLRGLFTRRSRAARLDAELEVHRDLLTDEYRVAGLAPDAARRAATRALGASSQIQAAVADTRTWPAAENLLRDLRLGARGLRRNPGFSTVAVLTLALGIAASATIFCLVNALLLRPLPVQRANRLTVFGRERAGGAINTAFLPAEFDALRGQAGEWSDVVATSSATLGLVAGTDSDRVEVSFVSENYWDALGLTPALGGLFRGEAAAGDSASQVLVLAYDYWQQRYGGAAAVIGRPVSLGGLPFTIIGVGPRGFHGDSIFSAVKVFAPRHAPGFRADRRPVRVLGFLNPATTLAQGNASLAPLSDVMARDRHEPPDQVRLRAYWERLARPNPHTARPEILSVAFFTMLACLVLILACVNVTNLLSIRTASRRGELAVRVALGASRGRLACQMLVEIGLLAGVAIALGVLLGEMATVAIGAWLPPILAPFADQLGLAFDWRVAAFVVAALSLIVFIVGFIPALRAGRPPAQALQQHARAASTGQPRGRRVLMVLEIASALVLLIIAGLFARSFRATAGQTFGFDRRGVLDFSLNPAEIGYTGPRGLALLQDILRRVDAMPGVESAALSQSVPMTSADYSSARVYPDSLNPGAKLDEVGYSAISPAYFETLRIPLMDGRDFSSADTPRATRVAIVNAAMARRFWPEATAIGRVFRINSDTAPPVQVIGVARDILNYSTMQDAPEPFFYLPVEQHPTPNMTLQVRSAASTAAVFRDVNALIRSTAPGLAAFRVQTMEEAIDLAPDGLFFPRFGSWLAASFGLAGLLLALVGVYGVVAYGTSQRAREMAVRLALGAGPGQVRWEVLKGGLLVLVPGLLLGTSVAAACSMLTANLYFGVSPVDPVTFVAAISAVGLSALAACYLPARRATRIDPVAILKE